MIVVVMIVILAMIDYPSYLQYKVQINRTEVQSEIIAIGQLLNSYRGVKGSFANANIDTIYGSTSSPKAKPLYNLALDNVSATHWVLVAKPIATSMQSEDGWVCLNSQGQRLWVKGSASCDQLAGTTSWE